MYEKFYGLKETPFRLTPDPEFLFLNKRSKDALDHILYGIERREGFALILGDVGTGKTTLCWAILDRLQNTKVKTALVQNPMLADSDILRSILQDLGIRRELGHSVPAAGEGTGRELFDGSWMSRLTKKQLIDQLNIFLVDRAQEGFFTVLIIDEAQNLSLQMLEQLRLLSNLETPKKKLLQIIFAGQLELDQKLALPALRQLKQRISIRFETKTLSREDTEAYIRHRLKVAGKATGLRFGRGAFRAICRYSKGYPRLINLICDRALLAGYSVRSQVITRGMVRKASNNLTGMDALRLSWRPALLRKAFPVLLPLLLALLVVSLYAWRRVTPRSVPPQPPDAPAEASQVLPVPPGPEAKSLSSGIPTAEAMPRRSASEQPPSSTVRPAAPQDSGVVTNYLVQVHSLSRQQDADRASAELAKAGYQSFTRLERSESGDEWYVVYVGPFSDRDDAAQIASDLSSAEFPTILRRTSLR